MSGCKHVFVQQKNDRLTLVGKFIEQSAEILFTDTENSSLEFSKNQASESGNISRVWAGLRVRELTVLNTDPDEIVALGRTYGIVTPGTSLLVLDSVTQYVEYNIEPPASQSDLRDQFFVLRSYLEENKKEEFENHFSKILTWWVDRKKWWNTDYISSYLQELKKKEERSVSSGNNQQNGNSQDQPMFMRRSSFSRVIGSSVVREEQEIVCEDISLGLSESDTCYSRDIGTEVDSTILEQVNAAINIQGWAPDTPYLTAIGEADQHLQYALYLKYRQDFANSPSFYLDCGDYFLKNSQEEIGLRILSNLEELQLGEISLLRIYAWRLQQEGQLDSAIAIFERILKIRDDEPQSHRDLALALSDRWQQEGNPDDATRAMDLLYTVVTHPWERFPEIEIIALMELNRLIYLSAKKDIQYPDSIDSRLVDNLDLDVRISMSWDADLTDVDLHVFEPDGGHAFYGHNRTIIGGLVSRDFTQGYGPEEYVLRKAMPGKYIVKAHYYGSHQQTINGPCTVTVTVFTNFGRENEQKQVLTLRLEDAGENQLVGEIEIEGKPWAEKNTQTKGVNINKCAELKEGMSLDEVKAILGKPDDISGDEIITLIYSFSGNSLMEILMNPRLKRMRHITAGATRDIL